MDVTAGLLGANAAEYSRPMDLDIELQDFAWARVKRQCVVDMLKALPALRNVADIGCRSGREAAYYRDEASIKQMHGFEISDAALDAARARGLITHVWISGEGPCPVSDASFDAITALDIIEHLFDTDVFLSELRRVLIPGGHLIVATPNLAWWWSRLRLLAGRLPAGSGGASPTRSFDDTVDLKHLRVSVPDEWRRLFESHGFRCIQSSGYNFPGLLKFPFNILDNALTPVPSMAHSAAFLLKKV